jgi:hypothetical protein
LLDKVDYYFRLVRGVREGLRAAPIADPEAAVRERFERRESDFVDIVNRAIYQHPANPCHALLRAAGCEAGDFADSVRRRGIEATLAALHREGVYLTHEEFKGRVPIARRGVEVWASPNAFANPFVKSLHEGSSSGSSGKPVRVRKGLQARLYRHSYQHFFEREHDLGGRAHVELKTILPDVTAINSTLRRARDSGVEQAWFCAGGSWREAGHYRLATYGVLLAARAMGGRPVYPRFLAPGDFTPAALWIAERVRRGTPCWASGMTSAVTRVAAAALEHGLDIAGTKFTCGGEALTAAKRAVFEKAGATPIAGYHVSEIGVIGRACSQMTDGNRVHHFHDSIAAITYKRLAPLSEIEVDSLLFTTLLPFSPILVLNVEMDDSGVMLPARCNCLFRRAGWTTEIRDIFSYGKLTGQGMTLVGTELVGILEETLPRRFGGRPGDFQLVEREGAGQTEMDLYVTPRLPNARPGEVFEFFFDQLRVRQGGLPAEWSWRQSNGLRVVVAEPVVTRTGKVHSLRLLGASKAVTRAS